MSEHHHSDRPLVIIAGPTATGKSAASVALCRRLGGSVISADSMQVYRGMDIGSAKITPEEMQGIPHYLIDCIPPTQNWNIVRFQEEAKRACDEILTAGRIPFLVGGTGFYIQSLLYDIDFSEGEEDTALRRDLLAFAEQNGNEALHKRLQALDPEAAARIHPNNLKRVIRAIEYSTLQGEMISAHNERERGRAPAFHALYFVLTRNREALYRAIEERVDRMMEQGLLREVENLLAMGCAPGMTSMEGLGYKQLLAFKRGECSLEEAVAAIKIQTRHFAKRQLTWFKREPEAVWVDLDAFSSREEAVGWMEEKIRTEFGVH